MKIEIDIPPHLMGYLDDERGSLWNVLAFVADNADHPHPTYAETIINILEQENDRYMEGRRQTIIDGLKSNSENADDDIPF